jgi:hypothetical protein
MTKTAKTHFGFKRALGVKELSKVREKSQNKNQGQLA